MSARSWIDNLKSRFTRPLNRHQRRAASQKGPASRSLRVEMLEERRVLALAAPVHYDTDANPQAIVAADFNNDDVQDLAVANYWDSTVSVLLGNPDGTFQPALSSPTGSNPVSIAVGDVDGDGILDLATAGGYGYYGEVSVLLGENDGTDRGKGTFQAPTSESLGLTPTSVAVGDFDGDGKLDLATTSTYPYFYYGYYYGSYSYAQVLLGNGLGGFADPNATWLGYGIFTSATTENFDGVGPDDLVAVSSQYGYYYGSVAVLTGDVSGILQGPNMLYTGSDAVAVAVGDVNADGKLDIVTANSYYNSVSVLLGDETGGFGASQSYFAGGDASSVVLGDFNHDLKIDIATASGGSNAINVLYGRGDGTFALPLAIPNSGGYDLVADDFNGDGWLDAATANPNSSKVAVLLNDKTWPPAPASLSIDDVTVTEGDQGTVAAVFTVTRKDSLSGTVTVNYSTTGGGAIAGSDFVANSGLLTFADGVATMTITILVSGDVTDEYDQGFYVNLTGASGAVIADSQGFGLIADNDPTPTLSITNVSVKEGHIRKTTLANFIVTLSAPSEKEVWVSFETVNNTAHTSDGDYASRAGTLRFAPGVTSQTVSIQVNGDKDKEPNETFFVDLSGPSNATILVGRGTGEIQDDDTSPGKGKGKP
jgi:hypothetical protein